MPRPRAAMRKIREVLRLHEAQHLSSRAVGIAVGLPRTTVRNYIDRAERSVFLAAARRSRRPRSRGTALRPSSSAAAILRRPEPDWATSIASFAEPTSRSCCSGPYADVGIRTTMPSAWLCRLGASHEFGRPAARGIFTGFGPHAFPRSCALRKGRRP